MMHIWRIQKEIKLSVSRSLKIIAGREKLKTPPAELSDRIEIEIPKDHRHGDLSTNAAMRFARHFALSPMKLAGFLQKELVPCMEKAGLGPVISDVKILPPGFINFRLSEAYLYSVLSGVIRKKSSFGKNNLGKLARVNVEFVSANPTGPLTVAHGRQAAVGDALSRILEFSGYRVTREYFINDVGTQIELLGKSIHARYAALNGVREDFPADGYHGSYINDIAGDFRREHGAKFTDNTSDNIWLISKYGVNAILKTIEDDLGRFGVIFGKWFSQSKLSEGEINRVLGLLRKKSYLYDRDGATWFKSTAFGDDKDRVVVKSDGAFTYLAPDIAYHLDKHRRGFRKMIDIWGPDHHGYVKRLKASCQALGYGAESLSVLIVQLATLYRDGTALSMSTRKGEFVTLREVMDEVGCDVAKFFFLMRKLDSHLDFDLEVAKKNSLENPVFYVQYAHARIASIQQFADRMKSRLRRARHNPGLLDKPEERLLLRMLCQFPLIVMTAAGTLEPYGVLNFLNELAKVFHGFYTRHRVVDEADPPRTKARLTLVNAVKITLANGLGLLGISFPDRM